MPSAKAAKSQNSYALPAEIVARKKSSFVMEKLNVTVLRSMWNFNTTFLTKVHFTSHY